MTRGCNGDPSEGSHTCLIGRDEVGKEKRENYETAAARGFKFTRFSTCGSSSALPKGIFLSLTVALDSLGVRGNVSFSTNLPGHSWNARVQDFETEATQAPQARVQQRKIEHVPASRVSISPLGVGRLFESCLGPSTFCYRLNNLCLLRNKGVLSFRLCASLFLYICQKVERRACTTF